MTSLTINVDLNKRCAECRNPGTVDNGLCMGCTSKAIKGRQMRSVQGRVVAERMKRIREERL